MDRNALRRGGWSLKKSRRLHLSPDEISPDGVLFSDKNSRYVRTVLRLKPGDHIEGFDGTREHLIRLVAGPHGRVIGEIVESRSPLPRTEPWIVLAFSLVRPGPIHEILRHGTELGVSRFVPILSRRTTRRPTERKPRWESIVSSACAQSGRTRLPVVEPPVDLHEFFERGHAEPTGIVLSTSPQSEPLPEILDRESPHQVEILVGPEGGFELKEEALAVESGFFPVRIGAGILRTETAAIAATAIVAAWYQQNRNELRSNSNHDGGTGSS